MLIDPAAMNEYKWPILAVTVLTLFGKFFSTTLGALLSGQQLRHSVQVGSSMAQIGEFAFIVASLGLSLGVISEFLFPVAVGASAITTFTTPYMIKNSDRLYEFLRRNMPQRWVSAIEGYARGTQNIQAESNWKLVLKSYVNIALTNGIILLAVILLSLRYIKPELDSRIENQQLANVITLIVSLGLSAPFIWALMSKKPDNMAYKELWLERTYNHGPLVVVEVMRNIAGVLLIGFWVDRIFSTGVAILVVVPVFIVVIYLFSKRIQSFYQRIEGRFLLNLNAREMAAAGQEALNPEEFRKNIQLQSNLQPWAAHIVDLEVGQHADYLGKTLTELAWREKYGINIAYIKRGEKMIHAPGRNHKLLPFDHVGIIATDEQMQVFKAVFDAVETNEEEEVNIDDVVLQKIVVDEFTRLKGKTIRNSGIREITNGLVVGIERQGERILNPDSTTVFEWGDIVWIVGDRKKIQNLSIV
jgi:CPA2 family monovalent cation:H+ antiporter-2